MKQNFRFESELAVSLVGLEIYARKTIQFRLCRTLTDTLVILFLMFYLESTM